MPNVFMIHLYWPPDNPAAATAAAAAAGGGGGGGTAAAPAAADDPIDYTQYFNKTYVGDQRPPQLIVTAGLNICGCLWS